MEKNLLSSRKERKLIPINKNLQTDNSILFNEKRKESVFLI